MSGMEAFQVAGGALACVDLALKLYKEIERFRVKVSQADEVGTEMSAKYGRLTKTLDDIHSALKCRKEQLGTRVPEEGEARIWVNIHDSLRGMKLSLRKFKKELEILDKGRDITMKRKWIDRAIWQLQLNKKEPIFDRLDEAASTHVDELSLSLHSLQMYVISRWVRESRLLTTNRFMHTETSNDVKILKECIMSIEVQLRNASISAPRSPLVGEFRTARYRQASRRQLQICLRDARAIVDKQPPKQSGKQSLHNNDSRVDSVMQDNESIWETDAESVFEISAAPSRKESLLVPPDINPNDYAISDTDDASPLFDDEDDDSSDTDDDDSFSDSSLSNESLTTEITTDLTTDSQSDMHPRYYTAQNSLETATSRDGRRTDSVVSHASSISFHNIDSNSASQLVKAIKDRDARSIERILRSSIAGPEQAQPSVTISKLPPLHYAIKLDAGPDVIRALAYSPLIDNNAREPDEQLTALHYAVKFNRETCCAHILSAPGVNLEAEDKYHRTALGYALNLSSHSDADMYAVAKKLLEAGARIPSTLPKGMSGMVEGLVKKHQKSRRLSSSTGASVSSSSLAKAKSKSPAAERRGSEESGQSGLRRRWTRTLLERSASARS